jgi:tetratricopeptide (TPR) repeat protein
MRSFATSAMTMEVDKPGRAHEAAAWLLAVAIAGSALALGTVHSITLCVLALVLAGATVLAWWRGKAIAMRPAATLLFCAGVSLTSYTALQCLPMPAGLLARLAPHNADVWSRALVPLHRDGPRWTPITLDPPATAVEVLKGVAYLLAFVTAVRIARQKEGVRFLSATVVITGLILTAAALLHPAFGVHKVFGVYAPDADFGPGHIAPLLNANNLAGYINVALCLSLAAALSSDPLLPRSIAVAAALVLGSTELWIASRSGVIAMGLGILLVLAIVGFTRLRDRRAVPKLSFGAGILAAAGAAMIILGGSEHASGDLFDPDTSKLHWFFRMMRMMPAVPVFGCGRGAFESAFPAFRQDTTDGYQTYQYPENVVAQWILEWGLPVGLTGLAVVAYALRPSAVLARSATATGAWAAIVALAVQNLADLGSEVPGLALAGVACAAIIVGGTPGHRPRWRVEQWGQFPRVIAGAGAVAAGVSVCWVAAGLGRELHDDQSAVHAALIRGAAVSEMHALERETMLRHPAEPYLPFAAALRAWQLRDESPMPWLGATIERAAVYGPAHLVLARVLAARSPSQARLEYRLAVEQAWTLGGVVLAEAPRLVHGSDEAFELATSGPGGAQWLDGLEQAIAPRLPATAVRLDEDIASRAPTLPGPALRAARNAVADVSPPGEPAPWCTGSAWAGCVSLALRTTARAEVFEPRACEPFALHARVRDADGDTKGALDELAQATSSVADRVICLQSLVDLATQAHDEGRVRQAIDAVAKAACVEHECVTNLTWAATREEDRGNSQRALVLYRRALDREPDSDSLLESVARVASHSDLHAEAADTYDRLARKHPSEGKWRAAGQAERQAAVRAAIRP